MELGEKRNQLGKRIAPGIWEDGDGCVHFSIPELLALFDLEDTPNNHEIVKQNVASMFKKHHPDHTVVFRKSPEDTVEVL